MRTSTNSYTTLHDFLRGTEADLVLLDNLPVSKAPATLKDAITAARDAVRAAFQAVRAGSHDQQILAERARAQTAEAVRRARLDGLLN